MKHRNDSQASSSARIHSATMIRTPSNESDSRPLNSRGAPSQGLRAHRNRLESTGASRSLRQGRDFYRRISLRRSFERPFTGPRHFTCLRANPVVRDGNAARSKTNGPSCFLGILSRAARKELELKRIKTRFRFQRIGARLFRSRINFRVQAAGRRRKQSGIRLLGSQRRIAMAPTA